MITTPEAVEAALRFESFNQNEKTNQTDFCAMNRILREHQLDNEDNMETSLRILAARVRELERERKCLESAFWAVINDIEHPHPEAAEYIPRINVASTLRTILMASGCGWQQPPNTNPQPEQAKEADEVLYGLDGQEILDSDWKEIVERMLDGKCEQPGEPFDAIAARIEWPVKVRKFRRMKVSESQKTSISIRVLDEVLESLDEELSDPNGDNTEPTAPMQLAARRFVDEVVRHYTVWACEPTGEVVEITREQAKEIVG